MFPADRSIRAARAVFSRWVACLAVFLLAVTWLCGPALQAAAQDLALLYEEDFQEGSAEGWNLTPSDEGGWWVEGNMLYGLGHSWAVYRQAEWGQGPHSLEFDLVDLELGNGLHVNIQHSDAGRYLVGFRRVDESHLYIYVERNVWDQPSEPMADNADNPAPYYIGQTQRVRIDFGDGQIRVYIDKLGLEGLLPRITVQDSQPLPPGGISFENLEKLKVFVDNVRVYGPTPEEPQTEPPQPAVSVPEYPQCDGEKLLYAENFEDAAAQDWNWEDGWSVGDGLFQGEGHFFANYSANYWEDLTLYVVFGLREGRDGLHFNTRMSDAGRYFVFVGPYRVSLSKQVKWGPGEQFFDLGNQDIKLDTNLWHTLTFGVHGPRLEVALDGIPQFDVLDREPMPAGGIAFETLDEGFVLIEAVWVCGWVSLPPPGSEPPEAPVATKPPEPPVATKPPTSPPKLPDLRIGSVTAGSFDSSKGTQLLSVAVVNAGDAAAGSNQILLKEQGGGGLEISQALGNLAAGEKRTIPVQVKIPDRLRGKVTRFDVYIDPDNRIRERDDQNNHLLSAAIEFPPIQTGDSNNDLLRAGGLLGGLVLILLLLRAIVRRLQRNRGKERQEEPRGLPPVLPPVRLLNFWLTEGSSGQGRRIKEDQPLVAGMEYSLHAQVVTHEAQPRGRSHSRGSQAVLPLDVVVFSPGADFPVQNPRKRLQLASGDSSEAVRWTFRANETGMRRARVCLYYGNHLLQSGYIDAEVVTKKDSKARRRTPARAALCQMLDYVASATLTGLERYPQPAVSIFTNQAANGADWIGVYAAGDPVTGFGDGLLRQVDPARLSARAGLVRQHLLEVEEAYHYTSPSHNGGSRVQQLSHLEQDLSVLASEGWVLYNELFLLSREVTKEAKKRFDQALRPPGLVAINRCRSETTTLPWAAIYDLEVDTEKQDLLRLCPVFKDELEGHWSEDLAQYRPHRDWLDNPQGCQLNPQCPLANKDEKLTICPFGFWGFRHQISQPLQLVQPTLVGQIPAEIAHAGSGGSTFRFDQTIFLQRQRDQRLKLAIGVHPGLSEANRLPVDLLALSPKELEITFEDNRDRVLDMLNQGGFHMYILYCHGDRDERNQKFKLVFGPLADERSISCENLNPLKIEWPEQPKPLVLLNGCETVAVTPEMVHGLLDRLHELGASGVVGTEIQIYPNLAYPFGLAIMERLLGGASLGEAFLSERKELLRKFNPLGLAYTYYAAAALHLHLEGHCDWCTAHQVPVIQNDPAQSRKIV